MNVPGLRAENNRLYAVEGPSVIGRDSDCQICVSDKRVSRRHASLVVKDDFLYIKDEHSSNGTYVNGMRINRQTLLQNGDRVRVGDLVLRAEYPPAPAEPADKTLVEKVSPFEDTGVIDTPGSPSQLLRDDEPPPPFTVEEDEQPMGVEPLRRRSAGWRGRFTFHPWYLWAGVALAALLSFAVLITIWNWIQPGRPLSPGVVSTAPPNPTSEMEITVGGGQVHSVEGVSVIVAENTFSQPVLLKISQVSGSASQNPPLPVGLETLGGIYKVEWQPDQVPHQSLQVNLPIEIVQRNSLMAAYRLSDGAWQSLGGLIYDGKLRFDVNAPAVIRLGVLRSSGSYGEYRPVLIMNNEEAVLEVRPWQWWLPPNVMTPGTAALSTVAINVHSHQAQELETSLGGHPYGYASLPYGTYSAWCVSWWNDAVKQNVYAILPQPVSLTPYSCTWEDYRTGQCEPEKAVFDVKSGDMGNLLSCVEAGKAR